ncbi:MAG: chromosome segregation protein SMC [Desulfatiglandaceae bacterium]
MKIKKLSILGFKSIMDRVDILFHAGISGIVGPNGCGKSNIVDAIRWCLGEQSPKQLRGRSMEDVIFSGTGERKPLGMAEVSLVFENGDRPFPGPYGRGTELSVTRRLYRSGDSEYLINNMPCRLKDIVEMFMDTGLGNKAYSIIGQGQIGSIVEQRPEETRIMLEEAAGITKYRKKAAESQKKIELTRANLQRVEDILNEVGRQMRSLKRQAAKAKRYKELSVRIQDVELAIHANNYSRLQKDSQLTRRAAEELVEQETVMDARLANHLARIESMQIELEEKDSHLGELRQRHDRMKEQVHRRETEIEALGVELRTHEELEGRLRAEQESIEQRQNDLEQEKARIIRDLDQLKEDYGKLERESALAEQRLKNRRTFLASVKEEFESLRSKLGKGAEQEMSLTHESGYLTKILGQITDTVSRLQKEKEELEKRRETLGGAADRQMAIREENARGLKELDEETDEHRDYIEEIEQLLHRNKHELRTLEDERRSCRSRLASLQALAENYEGYQVGVRTIMKADDFPERHSGAVKELLADIIHVTPEHERAVEAALGDNLQRIMVSSYNDGLKGVGYLKAKGKGKGSFVPIRDYRVSDLPGTRPSELTFLNDLVEVAEEYRPLIDALLGRIALVADLDEAACLWSSDIAGISFITPEGDFIDRTGTVSGGAAGRGSQGILARKREISELAKRAGVLDRKVSEAEGVVERLAQDIDERRETLNGIEERKYERREQINECDKKLFRLGQEMDQVEHLLAGISEEIKRKEKERARHDEALLKLGAELDTCRQVRRREQEVFSRKEKELKECESEFDQLRDQLAKLKTEVKVKAEEQRGLKREIARIEEYMEESLVRMGKIEEEIASGRLACEGYKKKRETMTNELHGTYDRLGQARDAVDEAERDRQESSLVIKQEEKQVERVRRELEELRNRIGAAKLEHSELTFKMDSIVEAAKERFDIDLAVDYSRYIDEQAEVGRLESSLIELKESRSKLGEVNLTAIKEYEALKERNDFITAQRDDLLNSIESLTSAIRKINRTSLEKFRETFDAVNAKLKEIYPILFSGGSANLKLTNESSPLESGVLVEVQPPGKKFVHMGLLSGGEKALVAMALLFAIYMIRPSPFCLLDEVDAPLDESNLLRFNDLLNEIKRDSQVIMITHNRRTMEIADRLFGVTMEKAGVSKTVAVDLKKLEYQELNSSSKESPNLN